MKIHRLLAVAAILATLITGAKAQNEVSVIIEPLTNNFPSQVATYIDNPFRYCRVRVQNNTMVPQDIYLTLQFDGQIDVSGSATFRLFSNDRGTTRPKITIAAGGSYVLNTRASFQEHFSGRIGYEIPENMLTEYTQVPEGMYRLCVQANRWSSTVTTDNKISEACMPLTICYTGSAPEFTSPFIAGMAALTGVNELTPTRNINIRWSEVITNCASSARFTYSLKIVKVTRGQNVLQAIDLNPVIFAKNCGSKTYCTVDTLKDLGTKFEIGSTYAMMVTAVQSRASGNTITVSNNGNSQVVCFSWGKSDYSVNNSVSPAPGGEPAAGSTDQSVTKKDNKDKALASVRKPYFVSPYYDKTVADEMWKKFKDEQALAPKIDSSKVRKWESDNHNILNTVPQKVLWMAVRGDAVKGYTQTIELYEDRGGSIKPYELQSPLKTKTVTSSGISYGNMSKAPDSLNSTEWKDWAKELKQGAKYYMRVATSIVYEYNEVEYTTTNYYVNGKKADSKTDSVVTKKNADADAESELYFQWDIDKSVLEGISPAQFKYPYDRSGYDWDATDFENFGREIPSLQKSDDLKLLWTKVTGLDEGEKVKYAIGIWEITPGKPLADILKGKAKYADTLEDKSEYAHKFLDSLTIDKSYVIRMRTILLPEETTQYKYDLHGDGWGHAIWFKLVNEYRYDDAMDVKYACYPSDTVGMDRTPIIPKLSEMIKERTVIHMGRFDIVVQKGTFGECGGDKGGDKGAGGDKVGKGGKGGAGGDKGPGAGAGAGAGAGGGKGAGDKGAASDTTATDSIPQVPTPFCGEGYVMWTPGGSVGVGIKVKLENIMLNKDYRVIGGTARTMYEDENNYIRFNSDNRLAAGFDMASEDAAKNLDGIAAEIGTDVNEVNKWYKIVNTSTSVLSEGVRTRGDALGVFPTPVKISNKLLGSETENVMFALNDMFLSPVGAVANFICIFNSPKDNLYLPFVATNICMEGEKLFADNIGEINLVLAGDYSVPLKENYTLTFKRPTKLSEPSTGCHLAFNDKGFKEASLMCEIEMGYKDDKGIRMLAVDMSKGGEAVKGKGVKGRFHAVLRSWDDWTARIQLDPFTVLGHEDWTFVPTGNGMYYDHSKTQTPKEVRFMSNYFKNEASERNAWQGFYLDQFYVMLPPDISTTFINYANEKEKPKDSTVYQYGANGEKMDTIAFVIPNSRLSAGAEQLVWDDKGLSVDLNLLHLLHLETTNGGGWGFSLDTAGVRFMKNEFKYGRLAGKVRVPLFTGRLSYSAQLSTDSIAFKVNLTKANGNGKDPLELDLFVAKIELNEKSSFFSIVHDMSGKNYYGDKDNISGTTYYTLDKNTNTRLNLNLSGKLTITFKKFKIDAELPGIPFENMYVRNYSTTKIHTTSAGGKSGKDGKYGQEVNAYTMGSIQFNIGVWGKASPQKRICMGDDYYAALPDGQKGGKGGGGPGGDSEVKAEGKAAGKGFNCTAFKPRYKSLGDNKGRAALEFGGKIGFGFGEGQTFGVSGGFTIYADVREDYFVVTDWGGSFDSIRLTTDIGPLHLDGFVAYTSEDSIFGDSWRGYLGVNVSGLFDLKMSGGFGNSKKPDKMEWYDWWYLEGALVCDATGIPCGPGISINGFGGGFAYNMMTPDHGKGTSSEALMNGTMGKSLTDQMVSSTGMSFVPKYDAWVAKAGVSLILTGGEGTMNASGNFNLRMIGGHFAGISLTVTAKIMSTYDTKTKKGKNAMLECAAMIDLVDYSAGSTVDSGWCLTAAFVVKSEIKFDQSFLKDAAAEVIGDGVTLPNDGNISKTLGLKLDESGIQDRIKRAKEESNLGGSVSMQIPIDFYFRNYGRMKSPRGKRNEWYFAIGKPKYDDRAKVEAKLDLVVLQGRAALTMYLMAGNYLPGGFELPAVPATVTKFFHGRTPSGMGNRKIELKDVGGFAMGMSFEAHIRQSLFIFYDVEATLGFDGALLYSEGASCDDYPKVGKNGFYGMGQVYAGLSGAVGIELNLGFWKGTLTLAQAGVGAVLTGGGPKPTWCYGMIGFEASILNGLAKTSTVIEFDLGDVCIPGGNDPLANVKLFQSIQPTGVKYFSLARLSSNALDATTQGVIVSNMPWNQDVILSQDEKGGKSRRDRKFRFLLLKDECYDKYNSGTNKLYALSCCKSETALQFRRAKYDANTIYFEKASGGGFVANAAHTVHLKARAFEYRSTEEVDARYRSSDKVYNLSDWGYQRTNLTKEGSMQWRDPSWDDGDRVWPKTYVTDTTIYFGTKAMPASLHNQVVYTWPYNGDPCFPIDEVLMNGSSKVVPIYLYSSNSNFTDATLRNNGERLTAYLLYRGSGGSIAKAVKCPNVSYHKTYYGSTCPAVVVTLPNNYGRTSSDCDKTMALKIYKVKNKDYEKTLNELTGGGEEALSYSTKKEKQLHTDIKKLNSELNKSKGTKTGAQQNGTMKAQQRVNVKKEQLQAAVDNYDSQKNTALEYNRKMLAAEYQATATCGVPIYTLYYHTLPAGTNTYSRLVNHSNFVLHVIMRDDYNPNTGANIGLMDMKNNRSYWTDWNKFKDKEAWRYNYLLADFENDDPAAYREGTRLPPVIYMGFDMDHYVSRKKCFEPPFELYYTYATEMKNIHKAMKATNYPNERPKYRKGESKLSTSIGTAGFTNWELNWPTASSMMNANSATKTGLMVREANTWLKDCEYRVRYEQNGSYYTNVDVSHRGLSNFYDKDQIYPAPSLFRIENITGGYRPHTKTHIDSAYFVSGKTGASTSVNDIKWYEPTKTIIEEVVQMWNFEQNLLKYGRYMHSRGYSNKVSAAEAVFKSSKRTIRLDLGDYPFTMPKSTLAIWYFKHFSAVFKANENSGKLHYEYERGYYNIVRSKLTNNGKKPEALYWQDHVIHYFNTPYEMSRTKGSCYEALFAYDARYKDFRDSFWDSKGGVLSKTAQERYSAHFTHHNYQYCIYYYYRSYTGSYNNRALIGKVASEVRNNIGEYIFMANNRVMAGTNNYYGVNAKNVVSYSKISTSTKAKSGDGDWFE